MISREKAGDPIDRLCQPLSWEFLVSFAASVLVLLLATEALFLDTPIHSLGAASYTRLVLVCAMGCIGLLVGNAWQLTHIWLKLRRLLVFLDRLPLRRTLQAIGGFSWGSIWNIGGNVVETRDKLTYRQFECLNHLSSSLQSLHAGELELRLRIASLDRIRESVRKRGSFIRWYSLHWDNWRARSTDELAKVQSELASVTAMILVGLLVPSWRREEESLLIESDWTFESESGHAREGRNKPHLPPYIQSAEEAVCLVFLGFIQNVIGHMRSLVFGIIAVFLSLVMLVSSYPFNPRPLLTGTLVVLFLGLGAVVSTVYSQMFRDAALSHLTNTRPGELGTDFWIKIFSIGIGPVLGLLTVLFPEIGGNVLSWLQPGMSALK